MNNLELTNGTLIRKVNVKDIAGFFSTSIDVPAGTKSLVFENGRNCGEMTPGHYTLQSFMAKLFLTSKSQVIYSCLDSKFKINYSMPCLTKESLRVAVELQIEYAIDNTTLFVQNLVGGRDTYTEADFSNDTDALIYTAIQEVFAQYSIKELGMTESRQYLITSLETAVLNTLSRYGIRFKDALLLSISHERFDAMKQQKEDIWLVKEGNVVSKDEREAMLAARFEEITDQEKLNNLEILEKQIRNDRNEGELAVAKRRLEYNKNLRKVVQADEFDKMASRQEMEQFLYEQDKAGVLREEEKKELLQGIDWAHEEKEYRRQQFIKKLEIQFAQEIEDYQAQLINQAKVVAFDKEIELARKVETEENRKWISQLEKEKSSRKARLEALDDEIQAELKKGEIAMRQDDFEMHLAENRRARESADAAANLDRQKQLDLWGAELKNRIFTDKVERLKALQELDKAEALLAMDLREREKRLNAEIARDEMVCQNKFKLDVYQTLKGMDFQTAQVIVLSTITQPDLQTAIIKSLEIFSQTKIAEVQAQAQIEAAKAQAEAAKAQAEAQNNGWKMVSDEKTNTVAQMQEMMKQVMGMQDRNADRLVQMNSQAVSAMGNMNNSPVVVTPGIQTIQTGGTTPQAPAQEEKKVLVCPQCRAEVSANQKYCPNCGKQL